jgi:dihydrofolate synthase/folylpolyglutamate synthase
MLGGGSGGVIVRFLEELAARRRFGMRPGLDAMRSVCSALGDPQKRISALHVAGTNGKGAVCAIIDSCLRAGGIRAGRYTSPHLVRLNERFFVDGHPADDAKLELSAERVARVAPEGLTFFEALTAIAFDLYAAENVGRVVLETGLGGRLDATNVCEPELAIITRIGLDHCDWLGGTIAEVAMEKAGIIKPGVPVVVGANSDEVMDVMSQRAHAVGAPLIYAPDVADESDIPEDFALAGEFNRENAVTALAALKTLGFGDFADGLRSVVWPGRFQRINNFIVDGAHNPPAARALVSALGEGKFTLIAGFCGDKDVDDILKILSPRVTRGFAVKTSNPRSLPAKDVASKMCAAGIASEPCESLKDAIARAGGDETIICGSLFLAGEALVALDAYPWGAATHFEPAELLRVE